MSDYIDFQNMESWLADRLKEKGFYYYRQLTSRSEEELIDNRVFTMPTVLHLSKHLASRGMYFKDGYKSLFRLNFRRRQCYWLFRNNGVTDLEDLELWSVCELASMGFGWEVASSIGEQMEKLGRSLKHS